MARLINRLTERKANGTVCWEKCLHIKLSWRSLGNNARDEGINKSNERITSRFEKHCDSFDNKKDLLVKKDKKLPYEASLTRSSSDKTTGMLQ